MYKPSRFQNDGTLPLNIYKGHYLDKLEIEGRFKVTRTLFRMEQCNFHMGVDLLTKN